MKLLSRSTVLLTLLLPVALIAQTTPVGGPLETNTVWSPAMGTILVYSNVVVTSNATLTIEAGTTVRLTNGLSISAQAGSRIEIQGTASERVLVLPMVGNNRWGTLSAGGNASSLAIRHAEIAFGGVNLGSQATGLIEDSYVHDVTSAIVANSAKFVTIRRVHVKNYSETIYNSGTVILAEDSLFENMTAANSDALEIQGGPPGSIIRRCTFRHSSGSNSDALDFNGTSGVVVEDCLVYDFSDKGVSMGASGAGGSPDYGMTIRNCFIYNVNIGVAVKDGTTCGLYNNTIADSAYALQLYQKFTTPVDGGHVTNSYNNILWGNTTSVRLTNNSTLIASYSDIQGTNWPGAGNISSDPFFLNPIQHDERLAANSPAVRTGYLGGNMGVTFPVGAPMALSHPKFESVTRGGTNVLLGFWADSEKSYSLQYTDSLDGGTWLALTNLPTRALPTFITITDNVPADAPRFYRLITPEQP